MILIMIMIMIITRLITKTHTPNAPTRSMSLLNAVLWATQPPSEAAESCRYVL